MAHAVEGKVVEVGLLPTHSRVVLLIQCHRRCRLTQKVDTGYPTVGRACGRGRVAVWARGRRLRGM